MTEPSQIFRRKKLKMKNNSMSPNTILVQPRHQFPNKKPAQLPTFKQKRVSQPSQLKNINAENDPYSWKFYYRMSKASEATKNNTETTEVSSFDVQTGTPSPLICVNSEVIKMKTKIGLSRVGGTELQFDALKNNYKSATLGNILPFNKKPTQRRNVNITPTYLKPVNSEVLLQKTKQWEQQIQKVEK